MSSAGAAVPIIDTSNRSHWPACHSSAERPDPALNGRAGVRLQLGERRRGPPAINSLIRWSRSSSLDAPHALGRKERFTHLTAEVAPGSIEGHESQYLANLPRGSHRAFSIART